MLYMCEGKVLMDRINCLVIITRNQSHNVSKKKRHEKTPVTLTQNPKRRTHKSTKSCTGEPTSGAPKIGMTKKGCVKVGTPSEGVISWSVGS